MCVEVIENSGRFVKQEQWKRWQAKRKLVLGPSTEALLRGPEENHSRKKFEIVYTKSCNLVRNVVINASLNTLMPCFQRYVFVHP